MDPTPQQCACGCAFKDRANFVPCLFDVEADPSEYNDLSSTHRVLLMQLWAALNISNLDQSALNPHDTPQSHSPPSLLGPCNADCAQAYWKRAPMSDGSTDGPICGVPGCSA